MKVAVVMPIGPGRQENVAQALVSLKLQTRQPDALVIVEDGNALDGGHFEGLDLARSFHIQAPKHEPGMEQPRNIGTRVATIWPDITHTWFVDSDIVLEPDALQLLEEGLAEGPEDRILVAPYDWLPGGLRPNLVDTTDVACWDYEHWLTRARDVRNDPRWPMFEASPPARVYESDLSAGLACFSGNLLWPISEFQRVGGFWSEIHHGRCEDGELGLRAVSMGVKISFQSRARGYHLEHPVDMNLALERNRRDVPMLNDRHPWVQQGAVFMVDRDGKAFDVTCRGCHELIPTNGWWEHAAACMGDLALPVP